MAALTTKNIKQLKDLPQLSEISLDDLLLLQDKSDDNEPYKRTTIGNITANLFAELQRLMAQSVFDFIFPVKKATVVQFPIAYDMETHTVKYDTEDPNLMYNNDVIRSTWVELDFDGAFFRANGGLSQNFDGQITPQAEGLPNITGDIIGLSDIYNVYSNYRGGAFSSYSKENVWKASREYNGAGTHLTFSASLSNSIYGASSHVTPTNYTVRVWLRTA